MSSSCCPSCCRAIDFGVHDYCVPCKTNPACPTSYPREIEEYGRRANGEANGVKVSKGEKDETMNGEKWMKKKKGEKERAATK